MFNRFLHSLGKKAANNATTQVDDSKLEMLITDLMNSPEITLDETAKLNENEKHRLVTLITKRHASKTDDIHNIDRTLNWSEGAVNKTVAKEVAALSGSANAMRAISPRFIAAEREASAERKKELELHRTLLGQILIVVNEYIASNVAVKSSPRSSPRRLVGGGN